jgi:hypothetical protein
MSLVHTFEDARRLLGLRYRQTVPDLVACLGLKTYPVPRNGKAKGLTDKQIRIMRNRLRPVKPDDAGAEVGSSDVGADADAAD